MSRKKAETEKHVRSKRRWPAFLVVGILILAAVLVVIPRRSSQELPPSSAAPLFKKQGEVTLLEKDGTSLVTVDVEVAEDDATRETGLMGRPSMEERQGMFFIFEQEHRAAFWMKNTIFPLDMIFISAKNEIVTIHRSTTPYSEQTYAATAPAQYVLEVNAGFCDKFGISEGDRIIFRR